MRLLIKELPSVAKYIFWFFFQNFEQKHTNYCIDFGVFSEVVFVLDSKLNLYINEALYFYFFEFRLLGRHNPLFSSNVMRVLMLIYIIHIIDILLKNLFLLFFIVVFHIKRLS